ncbi:hypothetical protein [Streptomyces sp. NPDC003832]
MSDSAFLNAAAILISIAAVLTSTWYGRNQLQTAKEANHLPVLAELLSQFRTLELNDHYTYVCTRLRAEHSPELGISGLPDEARKALYDVAYFLQTFAGMASMGIASEDEIIAMLHTRVPQAWTAIQPYVEKEREVGPVGPHLLALLEAFASRADVRSERAVHHLLARARNGRRARLI